MENAKENEKEKENKKESENRNRRVVHFRMHIRTQTNIPNETSPLLVLSSTT